MSWLIVNIFLLMLILLMAGMMALVGFCLRSLGLEPDQNPALATIGVSAALFAGYFITKTIHATLSKL